jgi:hypothetical protein
MVLYFAKLLHKIIDAVLPYKKINTLLPHKIMNAFLIRAEAKPWMATTALIMFFAVIFGGISKGFSYLEEKAKYDEAKTSKTQNTNVMPGEKPNPRP